MSTPETPSVKLHDHWVEGFSQSRVHRDNDPPVAVVEKKIRLPLSQIVISPSLIRSGQDNLLRKFRVACNSLANNSERPERTAQITLQYLCISHGTTLALHDGA